MSVHSGDIVVVEKLYQNGWALGYKSSRTVWTMDTLPDNAEASTKKRLKTPWGRRQDNLKEPVSLRFPLDIFCHGKVWKNVYSLIYWLTLGGGMGWSSDEICQNCILDTQVTSRNPEFETCLHCDFRHSRLFG